MGDRRQMTERGISMDKGKRESESEILERARRDMADQSTFPGGIPYDEQEIVDDGDVWIIKRKNKDYHGWPIDKKTGGIILCGRWWQQKDTDPVTGEPLPV